MRTIHKFPFKNTNPIVVRGDRPHVVHVGINPAEGSDQSLPCVWVEYDPSFPNHELRIEFIGTGHEVPSDDYFLEHVGTVVSPPYNLVWHVYERRL